MTLMGMETASSSFPSSSTSSSTEQWKYDVFLSLRGEDTRNNFMDHLFTTLTEKGINTFKDDEKLEKGKSLSLELLKAIEESRFAIVILSKDYTSSTWCLDELANIIACKKDIEMAVLPFFHHVDPSDKIIDEVLKEKNLKIEEEYDGVLKIKNRLCRKRILLVLDDVDKIKQLKMLAREHDWFGSGSKIIITTRDAHFLEAHQVDKIYEVKGLNDENALQLFSSKAFKKKHVLDDYRELSNHFLFYAASLPLALEVLGSSLFGKSIVEWKIVLERLQEIPDETILQVLEISFNGLQKPQKEIFLHIACFFNNQKKDYVFEILDILGLYPVIGLKELADKSLLKIMDNDILWMHDLLEEMGRNIVCQECLDDPRKHSRMWDYEDIDKGTGTLKAMDIVSTYNEQQDACWNCEAFLKMDNLKFLRICGILHVPTQLPNDLKILDWILYPSKSLQSSFQLDELVQLCLQQTKIEQLWIGIKNFDKLKFIDLIDSSELIVTPNFTGVPNLEKLVLVRCTNLCKFHPSIRILKKLIHLNLEDCKRLIRIPRKFGMESPVTLELSNCSKCKENPKFVVNKEFLREILLDRTAVVELIKNLPENLWIGKGLEVLDLSKADIEELPSSIERLTNLTSLTLRYCMNLVRFPNTICGLKLLNSIDLFGCLKFGNLPKNIGNVKGLELLNLCWTAITEVQVPYRCDELMGIEFCVGFSVPKVSNTSKDFLLTCWIKVKGFESALPIHSSFRTNYDKIRSPHLWQLYLSPRYFDSQWGENFRQIDGNGSNKIENRISASHNLWVRKVGIHYDINNDSASKGTQNKRSHDEDDGAGPCGEGYSNDEPPPKTWRI
ncbi:disease resistance protein RPV1-like [Quercus robur]|uniref:disease resistance protein RPV1-like n=1 Tax=Quercus robur TaxID=38942 RepID=UPI0021639326|nr:disease resistance protein RPV1-like [Quercus robur]